MRQTARYRQISLCVLVLTGLLISACKRERPEDQVLARVGTRVFTRSDLADAVDMPVDSLPAAIRWRILETWIERQLVDLEGERRGLDKDPALREKLAALKSDLYRSRLLAETPPPAPSDSAVMNYYQTHQSEFLRPTDAYLLELYWAEDIARLMEFRQRFPQGDSTLLAQNVVATEGRWLAETGELDPGLEKVLDNIEAGSITEPLPFGDGYRVVHLLEKFPAGTVLHVDAVRDEIAQRLLMETNRRRQDQFITILRQRYPVEIMVQDSL